MEISSARFSVEEDVAQKLLKLGAEQVASTAAPVYKLWHKDEVLRNGFATLIVDEARRPIDAEVQTYDAVYVVDRGQFIDVFSMTNRGFESISAVVSQNLNGTLKMPSPREYSRGTVISVHSEREGRFAQMHFDNEHEVDGLLGEGDSLMEVEIPCNEQIEGDKIVAAAISEGRVELKMAHGEGTIKNGNEGLFFEQASIALDTILR